MVDPVKLLALRTVQLASPTEPAEEVLFLKACCISSGILAKYPELRPA